MNLIPNQWRGGAWKFAILAAPAISIAILILWPLEWWQWLVLTLAYWWTTGCATAHGDWIARANAKQSVMEQLAERLDQQERGLRNSAINPEPFKGFAVNKNATYGPEH
jgi:hypothetical protein